MPEDEKSSQSFFEDIENDGDSAYGQGKYETLSRNSKTRKLDTCKEEACNCPSGRLVIIDNITGKTIEPEVKVQN